MSGPKPFAGTVRPPAVAGMFYPAAADECRGLVARYLNQDAASGAFEGDKSSRWLGGIVPHAGWVCSGAIAGLTIRTLARSVPRPDVVVIFGAVHTLVEIDFAALDVNAAWAIPGEVANVATEARAELAARSRGLLAVAEAFHAREHSVEVELPLVRAAWPGASVLPVEVPLIDNAAGIGVATAEVIQAAGQSAIYLASSDLTHYGPSYRFAPAGVGPHGLAWAKSNDRHLLDLVTGGRVGQVVAHVRSNANACGGGAIAAMMAACEASAGGGGISGTVLRHANSYETLADVHPQPPIDAVGYAAVVVGR